MPSSSYRPEKINSLLKEELAQIINREQETGGGLLTITRADISSDRRYATVFVSVLSKNPKEIIKFLESNIYDIQQQLNKRMKMRPVPRIRFEIDKEELARENVERVLIKAKNTKQI